MICFDPPFAPLSKTANFTSFTSAGFGIEDQRELAEVARQLVARGCHVVLSNHDVPLIRRLYNGFAMDRVRCSRAINSDAVDELIIVGRMR